MPGRTFSGAEFVSALSEGSLKEPIVREGMAKLGEQDRSAILFSAGFSCSAWTKVPLEMIEQVEHIGTINCRDHEHTRIRLYLRDPSSDNAVARVFADLLRNTARPGDPDAVRQHIASRPVIGDRLEEMTRVAPREPFPMGMETTERGERRDPPFDSCRCIAHCYDGRFVASSWHYGRPPWICHGARNEAYRLCNERVLDYRYDTM